MNTEDKKRQQFMKRRIAACIVVMFTVCAVVFGRLFWLQVVKGPSLSRRADAQTEESRKIQSPRGTILDRDGRVLAISEMAKSLYADPTMINRSPSEMAHILAPYLKIKESEIQERLQRDTAFVWLERTMDHDHYEALQQVIKDEKLQGLRFNDENHRYYPNGKMAAQLIGFVGENDQGLDGIEMVLDKEIKGDVQKFHITTDRNNVPILESALEKILPDQERSVQLTIDSTIQYVVEKGLDGIMQRNHPSGAAIIVMNPKTGEILAMGSRPNFDPNEYGKGNAEAYKNRAVVNLYEPGSTFKPIMAASALDSGKWDVNRVYHDVGYIDVDDRTIHNWDDAGMGNVTIKEILKFSINTGMAYIGMQMGGRIETEYARRFGFGQPTGIELPGEGAGILFDASSMSRVDEAIMGIGQGNAVTPLQMVQAFGAIANGGHMMKPYVIKEIDNPDGSIYKKAEPTEAGQPVSADVSKTISKIMAEEISSGGGQNAHIAGYDFCGKTGTAQRLNAEGTGYAEGQYIGSFVGFGPLEDPQFVVLIVVDNPSGVYYGAQVAAPVFKEIMEEIVRFKGIRPSHGQENLLPRRKQEEKGQRRHMPEIHRSDDGILMPSFIGWDNREVNDWLDKAGLGFVPNGAGRAVYQSPKAGTYVRDGDDVHVTFLR